MAERAMTQAGSRSRDRRTAILDAALACFAETGYAAASMDDVRRRSGASIGSIYHHFGGKEQLAAALYVDGLERYQRAILARLDGDPGFRAGVGALVEEHFAWSRTHPELAAYLMSHREPEVVIASQARIRELNRAFAARVEAWLAARRAAGEVADVPPDVVAALLVGSCQELTRQWLGETRRHPPPRSVRALADSVWRALSNPEGGPR